jgi:hypothetical protein
MPMTLVLSEKLSPNYKADQVNTFGIVEPLELRNNLFRMQLLLSFLRLDRKNQQCTVCRVMFRQKLHQLNQLHLC